MIAADRFLMDYVDMGYSPEVQEKAESFNKLSRLEMCGKITKVVRNPYNGKMKTMTNYCHQWRQCPICADIRKNDLRKKLDELKITHDELYISAFHEHDWRSISAKIEKKDYARFPIDGETFFLIHNNEYAETKALQTIDFHLANLSKFIDAIYCTPENRRISGAIGPFAVDEEEQYEHEVIEVRAIKINTTNKTDLQKIEDAVLQCEEAGTEEFHDAADLQAAILVRENRWMYFANDFGFYAHVTHAEPRLIPSIELKNGISWRMGPS